MSSRRRTPKRKPVAASVRAGLEDLASGNVAAIASMLDKELKDEAAVADALEEVMGVNSISAEQLLASYFEADMLSAYSSSLGKSGKGSAATLAARVAGEWAKPSFKAKRAKAEAEESDDDFADAKDWRSPLFYWRGELTPRDDRLRWQGAWVAREGDLPTDDEFAASENAFDVSSTAGFEFHTHRRLLGITRELGHATAFGLVDGYYLLDNGGGHERFTDIRQNVVVEEKSPTDPLVVAAVGTTEFGAFVSLGSIDETASGTVRMTLARRYVDDSDPRARWTTDDVLDDGVRMRHGAGMASGSLWDSLPWRGAA